jgi:hypothetical protein
MESPSGEGHWKGGAEKYKKHRDKFELKWVAKESLKNLSLACSGRELRGGHYDMPCCH